MHIIRPRTTIHTEVYCLSFTCRDDTAAGFSFPCDKDGNVLREEMKPAALANLAACLSGEHDVIANGVKNWSHDYREPAQGRCDYCGDTVTLDDFTNTCPTCGALYNLVGQGLVPQSQWEEPWDEDGLSITENTWLGIPLDQ